MKSPFKIKVCKKCKRILVANEINFYKNKGGKYGLRAECKECRNKYHKQHKEKNKEYYKEYNKRYYKENKEYHKEKHKEWCKNNKEERQEYCKQYRKENKEKLKENHKQYYEENKEKLKEQTKQYREKNPDKYFNYHSKRRELEENQGNGISKEQWLEMMIFFEWKCAYSGEKLNKDNRSIDHIIALNNGGLNEIWNCVPMYRTYNISKHTNDMVTWYKQQDFFDIDRLMKIYEWQEYAFEKWGNQ